MGHELKVFHSEISRVDCVNENHLYDLLKTEPAVPTHQNLSNNTSIDWQFKPNDKEYIAKHISSKQKVVTVGDVRSKFVQEIYENLSNDLKKQENYLLRKIRDGFATAEKTKRNALSLLRGNGAISKRAWHMISNINPENHNHTKQYVLWRGKSIQINGSKGGKTKYIGWRTPKINTIAIKNSTRLKSNNIAKKGLLRNSMKVNFKPGPLSKKQILDESHQKYQIGDIEVIKLPKPALEITPAYGVTLEPNIASFVINMRGENGVVSQKYAEFAVSMLGSLKTNTLTQIAKDTTFNFDLEYVSGQNRLLMRCSDVDVPLRMKFLSPQKEIFNAKSVSSESSSEELIGEIKGMLHDMLDSVEISINQDSMYNENESKYTKKDDIKELNSIKEKITKRKHTELNKLDVTIIKLPEDSVNAVRKQCAKPTCALGCVCQSLECVFRIKEHCGMVDCMFECKCEVSKYNNIKLLGPECENIIPGLVKLDKEINAHLTKEERKFHQTVVFSGEKSIILKAKKRHMHSALCHDQINYKTDDKLKRLPIVNIEKLSCDNIEPLCMVHNLYKCFCKGKFTESYVLHEVQNKTNQTINFVHPEITPEVSQSTRDNLRYRLRKSSEQKITHRDANMHDITKNVPIDDSTNNNIHCNTNADNEEKSSCARTLKYSGRRYPEEFYINTNKKIADMEQNDTVLKSKMLQYVNGVKQFHVSRTDDIYEIIDCERDINTKPNTQNNITDISCVASKDKAENTSDCSPKKTEFNPNSIIKECTEQVKKSKHSCTTTSKIELNQPLSKVSAEKDDLKSWLEKSYRSYKGRLEKGGIITLGQPSRGKRILLSYDFILSRYRERKNYFYVSKVQPHRTFLTIDDKNPNLSQHCINIDEISFFDLHKYPVIIQNLVTNAVDSENSFCILRGWDFCWEIVGSAVKHIEEKLDKVINATSNEGYGDNDTLFDEQTASVYLSQESPKNSGSGEIDEESFPECNLQREKSKWFVLQIENDFSEIQFYKRGFYVTYDGIQRSIRLARISAKTVRLSSKESSDVNRYRTQPYGIYAIPCISDSCVFIGPYEINEPLGIEIVKHVLDPDKPNQKKTKGIWIKTNKIENSRVIDNPLAYLPSEFSTNASWVDLDKIPANETDSKKLTAFNKMPQQSSSQSSMKTSTQQGRSLLHKTTPPQKKIIKVMNNNKFQVLGAKTLGEKIKKSDSTARKVITLSSLLKKPELSILPSKQSTSNISDKILSADITPRIKISNVYSQTIVENETKTRNKNTFITHVLKPEHINKKVMEKPMTEDIEKFLETSSVCTTPHDEILVISDDEEDIEKNKNVWIECLNIENFGHIRGKKNENNARLSFEFPDFKYTEFYEEAEAFDKINQVLARKIFIPKSINLRWHVVTEEAKLQSQMLTSKCLQDKKYLLTKVQQQRRKHLLKACNLKRGNDTVTSNEDASSVGEAILVRQKKKMKFIESLEVKSNILEQAGTTLLNKVVTQRDEISDSLSVPDNVKEMMSEALQELIAMND